MSVGSNAGGTSLWTESRAPSLQFEPATAATTVFTSSLDLSRSRHGSHLDYGKATLRKGTDDTPGLSRTALGTRAPVTLDPCGSSLLLATPSFRSMQAKSANAPLAKASSTLLLDSRSLLPGPSLLSDTPSFLGLKAIGSHPPGKAPTASQERPLREPRSSSDASRSPATNRNVTVQRLALDLPLSRSSSLSVFLHALEDAAPGWYQSLMESATLQETDPAMIDAPLSSPPSARLPCSDATVPLPCLGLPLDMLASLDALEALVTEVRRLPPPRSKTKPCEDIDDEDAFFGARRMRESTARPPRTQLASPPLTPTENDFEQGVHPSSPPPSSPPQPRYRESVSSLYGQDTPRASSRSSTCEPGDSISTPRYSMSNGVAVSNIANHPKLTRTLGLNSIPQPSRLPTPSTPRRRTLSTQPTPLPPPHPPSEHPFPLTLNKKASSRSLKAPKTPKALKSIFRARASAPPVPPLAFGASEYEYDEADSPVRKPPLTYRFSEAGPLRREDRRIDGMRRHFSSDAPPRAGRHPIDEEDSFLVF